MLVNGSRSAAASTTTGLPLLNYVTAVIGHQEVNNVTLHADLQQQQQEQQPQFDWITVCFVVINVVIAVLAVLGNCLVVYVVVAYRRMRTVTNYFIANLALSDILMALFCIPANTVTNLLLQVRSTL